MNRCVLLSIAFVLLGMNSLCAQPTLIHYWSFHKLVSGAKGPHPIYSEYSIVDSSWLLWHAVPGVVADTGWIDTAGGDILLQNSQWIDLPPNNSARLRNPCDSMELLWYLPTRNYKNLVFTMDCLFDDGPTTQNYEYSVDNGATYSTIGLSFTSQKTPLAWQLIRIDLKNCSAVNNQSMVIFRITFTGGNTKQKGDTRFDNITLEGDTIDASGITSTVFAAAKYFLFPNPSVARHRITVGLTPGETRNIALFNAAGDRVYQCRSSESRAELPLDHLAAGFYHVVVSTLQGQHLSTLAFTKE